MAGDLLVHHSTVPRTRRMPGGTMWILGKAGHAGKVQWHADRKDEAAAACSTFDHLCSHGYRAFLFGACQPARSLMRFDPAHAQLMLVPGPAAGWEDGDAWSESIEEAGGLLRNWFSGLLHKPAPLPPPQMRRQLRASREALALLLRVLSPRQRQSLRENGSFTLVGGASGLRYRIHSTGSANIDQLDARGAVEYRLQIAPACELAFPGWLAMQVLHLQDPETEYPFLAAAQVFPAHG
jgi:hypothetical protein